MTPQEVQHPILALLAKGDFSTEWIAKFLRVSIKTARANLAPLVATGEVQLVGDRWALAPQELQPPVHQPPQVQEPQPQEPQPQPQEPQPQPQEPQPQPQEPQPQVQEPQPQVHPYTTRIHELLAHLADGPATLPACPSRDALQQSQAIFPVHGGRWDLRSRVQPPRPKPAAPPIKAPPSPAPAPHPLAIYTPPPPPDPPLVTPPPTSCRAKLPDPATESGAILHVMVVWGCFSPATALPAAHLGRGFGRHADCSMLLKALARRGLVKKLGAGHGAVRWYASEAVQGYTSHAKILTKEAAAPAPSVRERVIGILRSLGATSMRRAVAPSVVAAKGQIQPHETSTALRGLWLDGVADRAGQPRLWRYWIKGGKP